MKPEKQCHVPVMVEEALHLLRVVPGGIYVDATSGAGGHAEQIAQRLSGGRLIALDRDPAAVALSSRRLAPYAGVTVVKANYSEILEVLGRQGIATVDGVLIDAGTSSLQLDSAERGFSFQTDGTWTDAHGPDTQGKDAAFLVAERSAMKSGTFYGIWRRRPAGRTEKISERCRENRMHRTSTWRRR